jgi:predicted RNase H-like HicB family nuclease/DNA-binding XRE family transcriptional regulator
MKLEGNLFKDGKFWLIEIPILDVMTQGHTRKEAFEMIADAIETLVDKKGFKINVYPGRADGFVIDSNNDAILTAFLLKQHRQKHGVTLQEAANRLGVKSVNAYARYEKGDSVPTISKFAALWRAISPDVDFILCESSGY